jgi:hypothetical protein
MLTTDRGSRSPPSRSSYNNKTPTSPRQTAWPLTERRSTRPRKGLTPVMSIFVNMIGKTQLIPDTIGRHQKQTRSNRTGTHTTQPHLTHAYIR